MFITIAIAKQWVICQLDINNALLYGFVNEEIYMQPLNGYTKAKPSQVCLLK